MRLLRLTSLCTFLFLTHSAIQAADIAEIGEQNRNPIQGKEVDWIDGDYLLQNDQLVAVIARPGEVRDANMTVRGVGACLIDLTRLDVPADQLSCLYPTGGRYQFNDAALVEHGQLREGGVFWRCKSTRSLVGDETTATIEYQLRDGDSFLTVTVRIEGQDVSKFPAVDGVRADRSFAFNVIDGVGYCEDETFRQTYGFQATKVGSSPTWSNDRMRLLKYGDAATLRDDGKLATWTTRVYPASSPADLWGLIHDAAPQTFLVQGAVGDQPRIQLSITEGELGTIALPAKWRSADDGKSVVHLAPGKYRVRAEAIGHEPVEQEIQVTSEAQSHQLQLGGASRVVARITSTSGQPIPCKVSFFGHPDPVFGTDCQSGSVMNCVYSADGSFVRSIPPGDYEVLISYGPEYNVETRSISVPPGGEIKLDAKLDRVVDTTGWISAELHSHSSPSGDNTSDQLGRVENLLCEHLEFAPCTEHQRIESYDDQLDILSATHLMATCSGMELTGSLLPINHQNAFPLKRDQYAQDGGGPRVDDDPVAQIARLAMWDDGADKVVQTNHPNMRQLVHDRDLDGKDDGGFSKMLDYIDIIEVHPPQDIFLTASEIAAMKNADAVRMGQWLELLKTGRRIPGVVNTDAHYNWNGSGWLRNWIRCSTDDPAQIKVPELIQRLESGQIVMSTGPFLSVQLHHADLPNPAEVGDAVTISGSSAEIAIEVQCANWLDVNRVEVFVNGEIQSELSRMRATHPDAFADGVVKFKQRLTLQLPPDSFIIVATIGEKLGLGRVMGEQRNLPPVAVSNPIFVTSK
jgi:hypothetical protein